jgi:hypothetical protein
MMIEARNTWFFVPGCWEVEYDLQVIFMGMRLNSIWMFSCFVTAPLLHDHNPAMTLNNEDFPEPSQNNYTNQLSNL